MGSDFEEKAVGRSGKGKVVDRGVRYPKVFVYVPKLVADDTAFPFQVGEDVTVTIEDDRLIIEKLKEKPATRPHRQRGKALSERSARSI
jgi:hypothetical protein